MKTVFKNSILFALIIIGSNSLHAKLLLTSDPDVEELLLSPMNTTSSTLLLTLDPINQTFTWTGSATSDVLTIPAGGYASLQLGFGNTFTASHVMDSGISISSYFDGFWPNINPVNRGSLGIAPNQSVYIHLGEVENRSFEASGSVTVEGNGIAVSYAGLPQSHQSYLESLHGKELFFQTGSAFSIREFGLPAGNIAVIPEPSSVALLAGSVCLLLLFWCRKTS